MLSLQKLYIQSHYLIGWNFALANQLLGTQKSGGIWENVVVVAPHLKHYSLKINKLL